MPDNAEDFLRDLDQAKPKAADTAESFLADLGGPATATAERPPSKPALPGASGHLASSADFSGKPPVLSGAFHPSLGPPDRGGVSFGEFGKIVGSAVGGGILDVADRMTGKVQEAATAGMNALLPAGSSVPDTSREGLSWEERLRTAGDAPATPRPVSGLADRINQAFRPGTPSVEATRAGLSRDPAVAQGLAAGRDASAPVGDTLLMIGGGGLLGKGIGATKVGAALNTVGVGRVATHAAGFAGANLALDPAHPREAIVNGITASLGAQGAAKIAAPWLGKILERAGRGSGAASPRFIGALRGAAEGVGMSAAPHMDTDGNWHSALLQGDTQTVAINVLLASLLGAGAKEVPPDVQRAYILGRVGEVPPEYLPVLNQIAGPVYDAARKVAAEGGAKSTNEAVTSLVKEDMGAFARAAGQRAEVEAGPRETAVLEAQDAAAAAPPPPTLPAPVEPATVAPAPATAPAEAAPALAPIGKTRDGRTVFGAGDKFYVRGTGGRLGAAHPGEVAEAKAGAAQAAPEAPAAPVAMPPRAFGRKSAATLQAEGEGKSLAQLVRAEGGIAEGSHRLTGEIEMLSQKEAATSGLVGRKGRGKTPEQLIQAAKEARFDMDGVSPDQFVQRLLDNARGTKDFSPQSADPAKLGEAALRRQAEEGNARLAELPPADRARVEAENQARLKETEADLAMERAEREAIQAEARGEMADADTSFDFGANVTGTTREGEPVTGSVVRTTDRSTIIDTPEGQRSIPKGKVQRDPPGIYMGSGFGGAQQFVEAVGPAIEKGAKALARHGQGLIDWVTMKTNPRMSRLSPVAGRYAGGIIGSHSTSNLVAPVWLERVFGENPSADVLAKFGHAAAEFQFTARRKALEAEIANAPDPVSKAKAEDALDKVGTFVGAEGSPFQTQADLDAYMASPEWKSQSEAWRKQWNEAEIVPGGMLPGPERMYRDLTGKTEDPDLFTSDDRDLLRVNMKPIEADAEGGTQPVYRSASGRLTAPRLRGHAFARPFSGTATKYETDPRALIQNTYQRVHAEWLKPQLYDQLIRTGDAARTNLKDPNWRPPTKIKGEDVVPFRITDSRTIIVNGKSITVPGETLYVRKGLEGELRQTLRTDPAAQQALAAKMLNTAALTGIADNVWNLMLDSMIPGSAPGHIPTKAGVQAGLANNVVGMLKQLAYTVRRPKNYAETALRLSADAAWRGPRGEEWTPAYVKKSLSEFFGSDPTTMAFRAPVGIAKTAMGGLGRIAQRVHEAGRIVLDQAFDNLVKAGLVKDDPVGRREFINRLGQYAGRGMGRFTEAVRDLGVQPFIVAKKKSAAEIGRKAAFSPGVKATDPLAAAQLRVGQAMRLFTFLATAGIINYVKSGSIEGRIGTPLGNTDTGADNEKKNPLSSGILGDLTGYGPMLRGIGATGLFKAKQQNLTAGDQFGEWVKGPTNAFVTKWLSSPVMDFGARLLSGKTMPQALGYGGGPRAEPAIGPAPQMLNNLVFAGRQAAQLGPVATQAADKVLGTNLTPEYAPDAADEFMDLLRTFAPKRGMTAETMGDMRAIRSHGKAADWKSWAVEKQRDMGSGKEWWEFVRKRIEESELEKRDKDRLLQDLAPKRGR